MKKTHVLFIGAGRMAQAMIEGIKKKPEFDMIVTNNGNQERLNFIKNTLGINTSDNWKMVAEKMDIIILALPPEAHEKLLEDLAPFINGQLVITVAAGINPTYMEKKLPKKTPVAWVIPNTAAKLGQSMTLFALGQYVKQAHVELIKALISGIGAFEQVTEQQIHELTAVSGSAPAFIYLLADALEQITMESGVTRVQARKIVAQMIAGSAEMLKTNIDAKELINQVATPGGSTAAGLEVLEVRGFEELMKLAIKACREKAKVK